MHKLTRRNAFREGFSEHSNVPGENTAAVIPSILMDFSKIIEDSLYCSFIVLVSDSDTFN